MQFCCAEVKLIRRGLADPSAVGALWGLTALQCIIALALVAAVMDVKLTKAACFLGTRRTDSSYERGASEHASVHTARKGEEEGGRGARARGVGSRRWGGRWVGTEAHVAGSDSRGF